MDRHVGERNRAEPQDFAHTNVDAQILTEVMKQFNTERAVFSRKNTETVGYLYVKK